MSSDKKNQILVELLNGRTLLGTSDNKMANSYSFKLKNVVEVVEAPGKNSDIQIALVPYKPYSTAQEETEVVVSAVATFTTPTEDINKEYQKAFSGIIQPDNNKGIIL